MTANRIHIYAPPGHYHVNVWTLDGLVESIDFPPIAQGQAITTARHLSYGHPYWRGTELTWVDDDGWSPPTWVWGEGLPPT